MNEPVRRKIKELEVMVAEMIYETPDTRTLVFFTGNDPLEYKPGHFLTITPQQYVFACGPSISVFEKKAAKEKGVEPPPRFLESELQSLAELGFPQDRIKRESYG